jgi:hypothetical protein
MGALITCSCNFQVHFWFHNREEGLAEQNQSVEVFRPLSLEVPLPKMIPIQ